MVYVVVEAGTTGGGPLPGFSREYDMHSPLIDYRFPSVPTSQCLARPLTCPEKPDTAAENGAAQRLQNDPYRLRSSMTGLVVLAESPPVTGGRPRFPADMQSGHNGDVVRCGTLR